MKVGTIGPFNDILSINTKNDLMKAKKIIKSDKIFKIYEKKNMIFLCLIWMEF